MPRAKTPATPATRKAAPRKPATLKAPVRKKVAGKATAFVDPEHRSALIAQAAYFRAQKRGFSPGHEVEDWLAAEAEVDSRLLRGAREGSPPT